MAGCIVSPTRSVLNRRHGRIRRIVLIFLQPCSSRGRCIVIMRSIAFPQLEKYRRKDAMSVDHDTLSQLGGMRVIGPDEHIEDVPTMTLCETRCHLGEG